MIRAKPFSKLLVTASWIAVLIAVVLHDVSASAQVVVEVVPPEVIATTDPVYFEGHAAYWYGGRWWYRNGPRWGWYDREPAFLYQRRMAWGGPGPVHRYYGGGGYRDRGYAGRRR